MEVVYLPLCHTPERLKGVYMRDEGLPIILLDDKMNEKEHDSIFAHEVGHHMTALGANVLRVRSYASAIMVDREEYRATVWATDHMMPDHEVVQALREVRNTQELAEYFGVTNSFAVDKLRIFRHRLRQGGVKVKRFRDLLAPELWEGWV
ncbi:MAG: ImmA/IrrE family metallo-endopeptidase [Desulfotomaculales bacterium]